MDKTSLASRVATYRLVAFPLQTAEPTKDNLNTRGRLTRLRKQPQDKQTVELLVTTHTCMACFVDVAIEWR